MSNRKNKVKGNSKFTLEQTMWAQRGSSSTLSLTSALDGGGWSTPCPSCCTPAERPGTHYTGGWVGTRFGLDGCGKSLPPLGLDPGPASTKPLAILTMLSQCTCKNHRLGKMSQWNKIKAHTLHLISQRSTGWRASPLSCTCDRMKLTSIWGHSWRNHCTETLQKQSESTGLNDLSWQVLKTYWSARRHPGDKMKIILRDYKFFYYRNSCFGD